jgi:hypothetical protein
MYNYSLVVQKLYINFIKTFSNNKVIDYFSRILYGKLYRLNWNSLMTIVDIISIKLALIVLDIV